MRELLTMAFGPTADNFGDWRLWVLVAVAVLWSGAVHELGHAWMADRLGDKGPREAGRLSLNPLRHIDPLGTLVMLVTLAAGFPLGWGKPVKTNPDAFCCGKRAGMAWVGAAGPLANLLLAGLLSLPVRWYLNGPGADLGPLAGYAALLLVMTIGISVSQFAFNLVPVHPMDMSHVVAAALPRKAGDAYVAFMERYGVYVFVAVMWSGLAGKVLVPVIVAVFRWLIGL
jgi:Zn-dependent protease